MSRDEWNEPLTPQQRIDEQVSALVDGELSLEESVLLEKRLERNANLQNRVLRYGLTSYKMFYFDKFSLTQTWARLLNKVN